jgi:hypothetical protein
LEVGWTEGEGIDGTRKRMCFGIRFGFR